MSIDRLSTAEAARQLGVHQTTIIRWIHEGRIPAVRVGAQFRLDRCAVDDFAQPVTAAKATV